MAPKNTPDVVRHRLMNETYRLGDCWLWKTTDPAAGSAE